MRIEDVVKEVIIDLNAWRNPTDQISYSDSLTLMGKNASIDSLTFITFITELEQKLSEKYGKNISLTDESALIAEPSPYNSIKSLLGYIEKQI